jgi:tRNA G18 (ribose-2'-O)-methylase SpoU
MYKLILACRLSYNEYQMSLKSKIILVAHDIRSTHNVGAFFRTCDGLGVDKIILSGYTPYPKFDGDSRLPYMADKITRQIHKTALGAETTVAFERFGNLTVVIDTLKAQNIVLVALEQSEGSLSPLECRKTLKNEHPSQSVALLVGNEIHGVTPEILSKMDLIMEIPMHGQKESLNVSVATAIALYELNRN